MDEGFLAMIFCGGVILVSAFLTFGVEVVWPWLERMFERWEMKRARKGRTVVMDSLDPDADVTLDEPPVKRPPLSLEPLKQVLEKDPERWKTAVNHMSSEIATSGNTVMFPPPEANRWMEANYSQMVQQTAQFNSFIRSL